LWVREISSAVTTYDQTFCASEEATALEDPSLFGERKEFDDALPDADGDVPNISSRPRNTDAADEDSADTSTPGRSRRVALGNRFAATKNRIGSAIQNARHKGKEMSDGDGSSNTSEQAFDDFDTDGKEAIDGVIEKQIAVSGLEDYVGEDGSELTQSGVKRRLQFGKQLSGVGQATKSRIGTALQSARQKSSEMSSRRRLNSSEGFEYENNSDQGEIGPITTADTAGGSLRDDVDAPADLERQQAESTPFPADSAQTLLDKSSGHETTDAEGDDADAPGVRRRLQISNRIGSVIQNARQRTKETPEKQPQRPLAGLRGKLKGLSPARSAGGDVVGNRPLTSFDSGSLHDKAPPGKNFKWTCCMCTFVNNSGNHPIHLTTCDMCGSERPTVKLPSNDVAEDFELGTNDALSSSFHQPLSEIPETSDAVGKMETETSTGDSQSRPDASRLGRFAGLGAAVRSTRLNKAEAKDPGSARFSFRKRAPVSSNESFFEGGAITLKKIHASGRAPQTNKYAVPVPLKLLEGRWIVLVKSQRTRGMSIPRESESKVDEKFVDKAPTDVPIVDANVRLQKNAGDEAKDELQPNISAQPKGGLSSGDNSGDPITFIDNNAMLASSEKNVFDLKVIRADLVEKDIDVEKICSLGDVLQLHAQISESLGEILPQLVQENLGIAAKASGNPNKRALEGFSSVDKVMTAGRILGGLLEWEEASEIIEKTAGYQGKRMLRICQVKTATDSQALYSRNHRGILECCARMSSPY
jgi:hypothetical protein